MIGKPISLFLQAAGVYLRQEYKMKDMLMCQLAIYLVGIEGPMWLVSLIGYRPHYQPTKNLYYQTM